MPATRNDPLPETFPGEQLKTDEQLMMAFSRGSVGSFTELFARYKQPLFGFFRRRLGDPACAEELTQDTFVAILRASHRYQPSALFRTYLYAIGFRLLHSHRRRKACRAVFLGEAPQPQDLARETTLESDLSVRNALDHLDSNDREVLLLREFEQLSYAEIAEVLELPLNTVRSRLFRARSALRELLTATASQPSTPISTIDKERV